MQDAELNPLRVLCWLDGHAHLHRVLRLRRLGMDVQRLDSSAGIVAAAEGTPRDMRAAAASKGIEPSMNIQSHEYR